MGRIRAASDTKSSQSPGNNKAKDARRVEAWQHSFVVLVATGIIQTNRRITDVHGIKKINRNKSLLAATCQPPSLADALCLQGMQHEAATDWHLKCSCWRPHCLLKQAIAAVGELPLYSGGLRPKLRSTESFANVFGKETLRMCLPELGQPKPCACVVACHAGRVKGPGSSHVALQYREHKVCACGLSVAAIPLLPTEGEVWVYMALKLQFEKLMPSTAGSGNLWQRFCFLAGSPNMSESVHLLAPA